MQSNIRIIELLRFLYQQTDEAHAVTVSEMIEYLKSKGIPSVRQTVYTDLEALDSAGIDIVQIKSTQNRYFIGSRIFEYPELKMLQGDFCEKISGTNSKAGTVDQHPTGGTAPKVGQPLQPCEAA